MLSRLLNKMRIKENIKLLRKYLSYQSHLSDYLPLMQEGIFQKTVRLYSDTSSLDSNIQTSKGKTHSHKFKISLLQQKLSRSQKDCYDPINTKLLLWYVLVFIAIIFSFVQAGVILTYGDIANTTLNSSPVAIFINICCILIFAIDIGVQLKTGYIYRGVIILDRRRVVNKYVRSFLLVDVLLIFIIITAMVSQERMINIAKLIIMAKFIRMFEIDQLYMRRLSTAVNSKILYVISKQLVTLFILAHTMGLFFYGIDLALTNDPICIQNNSLCWLYSSTAYSPINSFDWQIQYFYTLYWGINTMTTISYGDIAPNNPQETTYGTFCFCFGFIVYGYVTNNIIQVILWSRKAHDNFKHDLILYTSYLNKIGLKKEEEYKLRDYLQFTYFKDKQRSIATQNEMKYRLPQDLREQLTKSAYFRMHNSLSYLLLNSPSITRLLFSLEEKRYSQNQVIIVQGMPFQNLIYLHDGGVSLKCIYGKKIFPLKTLKEDDSFLNLFEFFMNQKSTISIVAEKISILYMLKWQNIEESLKTHTDFKQTYKVIQQQIIFEKQLKKIYNFCFFCKSNHHWHQCPDIFPSFKQVKIQKKLKKTFLRRSKKYHTWKNKDQLNYLQKINSDQSIKLLQKIMERIYLLSKVKNILKNQFDVDISYNWQFYRPQHNISIFKGEWKKKIEKQNQKKNSKNKSTIFI